MYRFLLLMLDRKEQGCGYFMIGLDGKCEHCNWYNMQYWSVEDMARKEEH